MTRLRAAAMAIVTFLVVPRLARAQMPGMPGGTRPISIVLSGGMTLPAGDLGDFHDSGFHYDVSLLLNFAGLPIGIRPEFSLTQMKVKETTGTPANTPPLRCYPSIIAPTGIVFYDGTAYPASYRGNLFFGDNNTGTLRRLVLDSPGTSVIAADEQFLTGFTQILDVVLGPDARLYVLTRSEVRRVLFIPNS